MWEDEFAVCLTHDIDLIHPSKKYRAYTSLKYIMHLDIKRALYRLFRENPYCNFEYIMELEEKFGAISTFFIIATGKDNMHTYDVEELEYELGNIKDNGFEIGLHGGYNSYNNIYAIQKEKHKLEKIINKRVIGYRNHFLRFEIPTTWKLLSELGFKYDSTFGWRKNVGFRDKKYYPFKVYNIIEIPLVIMDTAILHYMKMSITDAWNICKRLIDIARNKNGVITILWHNFSFDNIYRKGWDKLYYKMLDYCYKNRGWLTNCENVWRTYDKKTG